MNKDKGIYFKVMSTFSALSLAGAGCSASRINSTPTLEPTHTSNPTPTVNSEPINETCPPDEVVMRDPLTNYKDDMVVVNWRSVSPDENLDVTQAVDGKHLNYNYSWGGDTVFVKTGNRIEEYSLPEGKSAYFAVRVKRDGEIFAYRTIAISHCNENSWAISFQGSGEYRKMPPLTPRPPSGFKDNNSTVI